VGKPPGSPAARRCHIRVGGRFPNPPPPPLLSAPNDQCLCRPLSSLRHPQTRNAVSPRVFPGCQKTQATVPSPKSCYLADVGAERVQLPLTLSGLLHVVVLVVVPRASRRRRAEPGSRRWEMSYCVL
jgi:hypothetical protein